MLEAGRESGNGTAVVVPAEPMPGTSGECQPVGAKGARSGRAAPTFRPNDRAPVPHTSSRTSRMAW